MLASWFSYVKNKILVLFTTPKNQVGRAKGYPSLRKDLTRVRAKQLKQIALRHHYPSG